jgi:hypothetical protein
VLNFFFQALNFSLPEEDMASLNRMHRDLRIINLENFPKTLESNQPDGYKMKNFTNKFPAHLNAEQA